jgi:uncharacterized protein with PIN domain/sulfur carrier protein ThiS
MARTYDRNAGMASASFRFHGELNAFLARERRGVVFATSCARAATFKHAIEALGVPHTEVMRVTVNGAPATLSRIVREGDAVEVFPPEAAATGETPRFFADAHLGGLARLLRMLGFDVAFDPALHDRGIVVLVGEERRVLLSRDRELLKCREVLHGCYVRALKPESQLAEVAARYALEGHMRPFTRCLHCNLALHTLDRSAVRGRVPDGIVEKYDEFVRCPGCDRIYWQGTHWEHMRAMLGSALERPVGAGP